MDAALGAKSLKSGLLTVDPPLYLAPMAGLTHSALRSVIAGFGGAGCLSTEMLSARSLVREDPATSPYLAKTPEEKPLSYQILASNPQEAAQAAAIAKNLGADAIDLNFGCPAPDIRRRGGGSKLMESLGLSRAVVEAARSAAGDTPLSAKIRLGETLDEARLKDFCLMLQDGGVDLVIVHARLRGERYGRRPRWDWAGKVKSWLKVPVVANGSIFTVDDARACLNISGCDGLMIGRGAAIRPWIFRDVAREVYGVGLSGEAVHPPDVHRRFRLNLEERFPPDKRLGRLKEFTRYHAENYAFGHTLSSRVQSCRSFEEAHSRAEEFFSLLRAPVGDEAA